MITEADGFLTVTTFDKTYGGGTCGNLPCPDSFATKLNPGASGSSALLYSIYLEGNNSDISRPIAVDGVGYAYLFGDTFSRDFPSLNPFQPNRTASHDLFIAKLDPSAAGGTSLFYHSYLGGNGYARCNPVIP